MAGLKGLLQAALLACGVVLLGSAPAGAGVRDQSNRAETTFSYGVTGEWPVFQIFTPGVSGELDRVDLRVSELTCSDPDVLVEIQSTAGGLPSDEVLASRKLLGVSPGLETWMTLKLSRTAIVTAGRQYALVARAPKCSYMWGATGGDPYPGGDGGSTWGGSAWFIFADNPRTDFPFETFMKKARCGGRYAPIVGSRGTDYLQGAAKRDVVLAYGGRDFVRGRGGNDVICGAQGGDLLRGGPGRDRLIGGPGRDRLIGGPGRDICVGGPGRDTFRGCEVVRTR